MAFAPTPLRWFKLLRTLAEASLCLFCLKLIPFGDLEEKGLVGLAPLDEVILPVLRPLAV